MIFNRKEISVIMKIDFSDVIPIYIQIADAIEDDILSGKLKEGDKCYSQIVIAKELNINPATAAKGIRLLVDRGVLDKVRGQAMTISEGAIKIIKERKSTDTITKLIENLIEESNKLGITKDELLNKISNSYNKEA
ncbi:MAG: GntR family transcriptional regulator [Lachnospiraceae bacterium]|nr:GntR family transcriptional regulator [Lachnospiraceae bacterium]